MKSISIALISFPIICAIAYDYFFKSPKKPLSISEHNSQIMKQICKRINNESNHTIYATYDTVYNQITFDDVTIIYNGYTYMLFRKQHCTKIFSNSDNLINHIVKNIKKID